MVSANLLLPAIGAGAGRGRRSAACINALPNSAAVKRSAANGRPARSSTDANGPKSADTGISLSMRAFSVATVESDENGTWPVTDSMSTRHNE